MTERDELVLAVAVLLALEINQPIIRLLEKIDPKLPHFSLKIVYAKLIFLYRDNTKRAENLLEELNLEYKKATKRGKKADLAVGLAYLMFRLWALRGGIARWRLPPSSDLTLPSKDHVQKLVESAIDFAKQAYQGLSSAREQKKKVYALNQYLYYLVEGGTNDRIHEMVEAAQTLSSFAESRQIWQYRFDDTLGRFFHRMATTKTDENEWKTAMKTARMHIERAAKAAHDDQEVYGYLSKIGIAIEAGFEALKKPKRPPRVIKVGRSKNKGD